MPHEPIAPDWDSPESASDVPAPVVIPSPFQQVKAFPTLSSPVTHVTCTTCGDVKELGELSSKYGKAQLVGQVREKGLWEARCRNCEPKPHKGMQSIWREE